MRKVISGLFISLDAVVEAPDQWQFDLFDADMGAAMSAVLDAEDTMLLGRRTYEAWVNYWPNSSDEPFASHINHIPKYVFSNSLDQVSWGQFDNVTLVQGDPAPAIQRLKQQAGKNIGVAGSPSLVRSLLFAGLLDELILAIHPVIVGRGQRLFRDGDDLTRLNLVASQVTASGIAILTYQPRGQT